MAKNLVIVESPAKAKTINKILGPDFVVKASMGHVRDLPVKVLGVDVDKGFALQYEVVKGRKKVVDELEAAAKDCDAIYLAPDPDREGEAIAWHLKTLLEAKRVNKGKTFYRVTYNEITPRAVREAFAHPGEIHMHRVDAQQARRVVDRIVGYKVSPLLWRRVQRGLSAGRVQSVALRLVCEREREILDFKPEAYWIFGADVRKMVAPNEPFRVKLVKIDGEKAEIHTAEEAARVTHDLKGCAMRVAEIKTRMVRRNPYPPFITSTLQQAASTFLRISPKQTMSIAQKLYEGVDMGDGPTGLITYMRTDSVSLSEDAIAACRDFIGKSYGSDYLPEKANHYKSRGSAQEAHEAIRPTDVTITPDKAKRFLDAAGLKVYALIWERFVACQMVPAQIQQRTVCVEAPVPAPGATAVACDRTYLFTATVSETKFDGYRRVAADADKKEEDHVEYLPVVHEGEPLVCLELVGEQKETQPPARYSEAALVKALEANGVGRPSTYAQILTTLQQRNYVESRNRTLHPSEIGMKTNAFLTTDLPVLFDVQFTADMEAKLDEIEEGTVDWGKMLADFYEQFEKWVAGSKAPAADPGKVKALLAVLENVKAWTEPVKRGKRTYDDHKFVKSLAEALEAGEKPISERQIEALAKIAARYKEQVPDIAEVMSATGFQALLESPDAGPPRDSSFVKFEALAKLSLDEKTQKFVESLSQQAQSGRRLSMAQLGALDRIVMQHASQIEGFEGVRASMELASQPVPEADHESGPLLALMVSVTEWAAPVTRGRREFDDSSFYQSLKKQFDQRGALSDKQRAALKKMVVRYREQIPGFAEAQGQFDLKIPAGKRGSKSDE
jgi:DNA topoisomerase I